jgi:hypothetical protein
MLTFKNFCSVRYDTREAAYDILQCCTAEFASKNHTFQTFRQHLTLKALTHCPNLKDCLATSDSWHTLSAHKGPERIYLVNSKKSLTRRTRGREHASRASLMVLCFFRRASSSRPFSKVASCTNNVVFLAASARASQRCVSPLNAKLQPCLERSTSPKECLQCSTRDDRMDSRSRACRKHVEPESRSYG